MNTSHLSKRAVLPVTARMAAYAGMFDTGDPPPMELSCGDCLYCVSSADDPLVRGRFVVGWACMAYYVTPRAGSDGVSVPAAPMVFGFPCTAFTRRSVLRYACDGASGEGGRGS